MVLCLSTFSYSRFRLNLLRSTMFNSHHIILIPVLFMQILSVIILVKGGPLLKNEGIYISLNYVVRLTPLPQGFARREQWDNVIWIIFMLNFSYFHLNTKKLCIFPIFEWRNVAFEINLSHRGDCSDFMTTHLFTYTWRLESNFEVFLAIIWDITLIK